MDSYFISLLPVCLAQTLAQTWILSYGLERSRTDLNTIPQTQINLEPLGLFAERLRVCVHGHAFKSGKFYWIGDIYDMAHQLAHYENDVHLRKHGAKEALENFKNFQKETAKAIMSVSIEFI